ncbi:MAG: histidine phosphatase family protein [Myxococcota bacterium]
MNTVWLLRHAKSSWSDADASDHERTLNARGRDAARRIGRHLETRGARFDAVLCSSAVRTRETAEILATELGAWPGFEPEPDLYLAEPSTLLGRLEALPASVDAALVIAHNPGIAALAVHLARRGERAQRERLRSKFPTAALAQIELEGSWSEIGNGGRLVHFAVPRELPPPSEDGQPLPGVG